MTLGKLLQVKSECHLRRNFQGELETVAMVQGGLCVGKGLSVEFSYGAVIKLVYF